jgi:hypothetical protein
MEFTVINKSKKPNSTAITIESKEPYTYYIREFEGDLNGLDDETLIKRVLDLILVELDPSGAVAKMQTVIKEAQHKLEQATNRTIVNSDAMMELTATLSADIAEIKGRLHALDGKGATEPVAPTAESHETTTVAATEEHHDEVAQPVAVTEEKHEEAPQPTSTVATEPTVTPVAETTVTPVAEPQPVATPTAETTVTPTTVQGDGNNDSDGKVEEHNAESTASGNNSVQ